MRIGNLIAIDSTFVSAPGSTISVNGGAEFVNCTFTTHNRFNSTAGHDELWHLVEEYVLLETFEEWRFISPSGSYVDYGNCTPGRNPGPSGANILVSDGSFTGCPFACPLGTWGRGGPTATLQAISTGCGVGCETCPAGAVCDVTALTAPNYCTVGHYNPDTGSQTAGGCRECERCALAAACRRPLPIAARLCATRVLRAQWEIPSGDWFPAVQPVPSRHLL